MRPSRTAFFLHGWVQIEGFDADRSCDTGAQVVKFTIRAQAQGIATLDLCLIFHS